MGGSLRVPVPSPSTTGEQEPRRRGIAQLEAGIEQPGRLRREEDRRRGRERSEGPHAPAGLPRREQQQDHQRRARNRSAGPGDRRIEDHDAGEKKATDGRCTDDEAEDERRPSRHQRDVESREGEDVVDAGSLQAFLEIGREGLPFAEEERQQERRGRPVRFVGGRLETPREPLTHPRSEVPPERLAARRLHETRALDRSGQVDVAALEGRRVIERAGVAPGSRPADAGGRLEAVADAPRERPLRVDRHRKTHPRSPGQDEPGGTFRRSERADDEDRAVRVGALQIGDDAADADRGPVLREAAHGPGGQERREGVRAPRHPGRGDPRGEEEDEPRRARGEAPPRARVASEEEGRDEHRGERDEARLPVSGGRDCDAGRERQGEARRTTGRRRERRDA